MVCGTKKRLQVHHKTYKRIYNENLERDLITLCRFHHQLVHLKADEWNIDIWHATMGVLDVWGKPELRKNKTGKIARREIRRKIRKEPKPVARLATDTEKTRINLATLYDRSYRRPGI